jgi:(E)-4-hydroxy-3-methylbut-2-enyl-diphosphate synthase
MTTAITRDTLSTLKQIETLTDVGCEIIRVAVPKDADADALAEIVANSPIPVVADVHFHSKFVYKAIDAGCGGVRVNPGNILHFETEVPKICATAKSAGVSLRIGVNAGSLDDSLRALYFESPAEALVESALREAKMFEDNGFYDFKISVKHHDPIVTVKAYEMLAKQGDWPLHLGVTEAGLLFDGTIKGVSAIAILLSLGIGDTIRLSLTANPIEEIKLAKGLLQALRFRTKPVEIIACPTCGRCEIELIELAEKVENAIKDLKPSRPLKVAVMGCAVNGPGEAKEADLGLAGGKGRGILFAKGKVIKTVKEGDMLDELIKLINQA